MNYSVNPSVLFGAPYEIRTRACWMATNRATTNTNDADGAFRLFVLKPRSWTPEIRLVKVRPDWNVTASHIRIWSRRHELNVRLSGSRPDALPD
ncbi:hypothetical protein LCGC14_1799500 [marine sediment metagenome]|uniref:Uncharacterized protein n=1 Tax=marine sediment metagenome TaxID=412755 RepID=A0A0F9J4U7_9ZZZZ